MAEFHIDLHFLARVSLRTATISQDLLGSITRDRDDDQREVGVKMT